MLVSAKTPAPPAGVFNLPDAALRTLHASPVVSRRLGARGLRVGDRETRADGQGRELIDGVPPGAPVGKLLLVELLRHARLPFAGFRPDYRARIELAAIDAHRAAKATADLERWLDDGIARQARRHWCGTGLLRWGRIPFSRP